MPHTTLRFIELTFQILKEYKFESNYSSLHLNYSRCSLNKAPDYTQCHGAILTKLKKQY